MQAKTQLPGWAEEGELLTSCSYYTTPTEIKERIDIVDIVGEVINLTRRGNRYFGLCCFHSEKTPSFMVDPDNKRAHCYGCGWNGDAFDFVQAHFHFTDFKEAYTWLAERAGIALSEKIPIEAYRARRKAEQERQKKQAVERALAKLVKVTRLEVFAAERWVYSIRKTIVGIERLDSPIAQWAIKHGPHIERIADTLISGTQAEQMQACLAWEGLKRYGKLFR